MLTSRSVSSRREMVVPARAAVRLEAAKALAVGMRNDSSKENVDQLQETVRRMSLSDLNCCRHVHLCSLY